MTPAIDPQWAAVVAWAIWRSSAPNFGADQWSAAGEKTAAVNGADLGLPDDWGTRVIAAAGTYADIYARNLGNRRA